MCDPHNDICNHDKGLVCGNVHPYTCRYGTTTTAAAATTTTNAILATELETPSLAPGATLGTNDTEAAQDLDARCSEAMAAAAAVAAAANTGAGAAASGGSDAGLYICIGIIVVLLGVIIVQHGRLSYERGVAAASSGSAARAQDGVHSNAEDQRAVQNPLYEQTTAETEDENTDGYVKVTVA